MQKIKKVLRRLRFLTRDCCEIPLFASLRGSEAIEAISKKRLLRPFGARNDSFITVPTTVIIFSLIFQAVMTRAGFAAVDKDEISDLQKDVLRQKAMLKAMSIEETFLALQRGSGATYTRGFASYEIEKPADELRAEAAIEDLQKKASSVPERPAVTPLAARPSVQLRGRSSYTVVDYNLLPSFHALVHSLSGRFYDFDLRYESNYEDINNRFRHDYTYLNFYRPGLFMGFFDQSTALAPLRSQAEAFNGMKVIKDGLNYKTTFVAGETDNVFFGDAGSVKYEGGVYGIRQNYSPAEWLDLGGALYYMENEAVSPHQAGTTSFPRQNKIFFTESILKPIEDFSVSAHLAQSNFHPDNDPDEIRRDLDWRLASLLKKDRYRVGLDYEFVGDNYASLGNPLSYQDYAGWNLFGDYNLTEEWQVSGSLTRYNNNVSDDPSKTTQANTGFSMSSYYRLPRERGLNLAYSHFETETSSSVDQDSDTITNLYRFDYFTPFLFATRAAAGYQVFVSATNTPDVTDYYQFSPVFSLFRSFGKGSSWYLSHQFTDTNNKQGSDAFNSSTSFNINYVLNDLINLYFNTNYARDKSGTAKAVNTLSASSGLNWRIFTDTNFDLQYNVHTYNLDTEKKSLPENWSIMGRISQYFNIASPPNFGIIQGQVFNDTNGNGKADAAEQGLEEVRLFLSDNREVFTDKHGRYKFQYVTPGTQEVFLDLGSLSWEWTTEETSRKAQVLPRKKIEVNFAVLKSATIQGRVFIDANSDSLYQESEEPLENAAVVMTQGEQFRRTDQEGLYRFENLLPGRYKIWIYSKDIPDGYDLVSSKDREVKLGVGEKAEGLDFILRIKPSEIKKF